MTALDDWLGNIGSFQQDMLDFQRSESEADRELRAQQIENQMEMFKQQLELDRDRLEQVEIPRVGIEKARQKADEWYQEQQVKLGLLSHMIARGNLGLDYLKQATEYASTPDNYFKLVDFMRGAKQRGDVPVYLKALMEGVQMPAWTEQGGQPVPRDINDLLSGFGYSPTAMAVGQSGVPAAAQGSTTTTIPTVMGGTQPATTTATQAPAVLPSAAPAPVAAPAGAGVPSTPAPQATTQEGEGESNMAWEYRDDKPTKDMADQGWVQTPKGDSRLGRWRRPGSGSPGGGNGPDRGGVSIPGVYTPMQMTLGQQIYRPGDVGVVYQNSGLPYVPNRGLGTPLRPFEQGRGMGAPGGPGITIDASASPTDPRISAAQALVGANPPSTTDGYSAQDVSTLQALSSLYASPQSVQPGGFEALTDTEKRLTMAGFSKLGGDPASWLAKYAASRPGQGAATKA